MSVNDLAGLLHDASCSGQGGVEMAEDVSGWLTRPGRDRATDEAGAVLRAWRKRHRHTQVRRTWLTPSPGSPSPARRHAGGPRVWTIR